MRKIGVDHNTMSPLFALSLVENLTGAELEGVSESSGT